MYIPVTAWSTALRCRSGPRRVDLQRRAAAARFYSPFWQMVYFEVPDGTPPDAITSARQVLDGKYPLHFGPGRTVSLVPDGLVGPPGGPPDVALTQGTAWLEGQPASFIDFGKATFTWNERRRDRRGPDLRLRGAHRGRRPGGAGHPDRRRHGAARIGRAAARRSRAASRATSAYWRIYTVTLPPTARVFSPAPDLQAKLRDDGVPVVEQYTAEALGYASQVSGWVALNPGGENGEGGCWATADQVEPDPMNITAGKCIWLNSQAAIETNIDRSAIRRTDVTVTCPFVTFDGRLVSPIK